MATELEQFVEDMLVWLPKKFKDQENFLEFVEAFLQLVYELRNNIENIDKLYSPKDLEEERDLLAHLEKLLNVIPAPSEDLPERVTGVIYASDFIRIKGLEEAVQYYLYKKKIASYELSLSLAYLWSGPVGSAQDYETFIDQESGIAGRAKGDGYYATPHFYVNIEEGTLTEDDSDELLDFIDTVRPIEAIYVGAFARDHFVSGFQILLPEPIVLWSYKPPSIAAVVVLKRPAYQAELESIVISDSISLICSV